MIEVPLTTRVDLGNAEVLRKKRLWELVQNFGMPKCYAKTKEQGFNCSPGETGEVEVKLD